MRPGLLVAGLWTRVARNAFRFLQLIEGVPFDLFISCRFYVVEHYNTWHSSVILFFLVVGRIA